MKDLTIKDIARMAGVSISTASRAINNNMDVSEKTKEKIQRIARENHFIPNSNAKNLKQTATNNIGVIVKGHLNTFFAAIVELLQEQISANGYTALVNYIAENGDEVKTAQQMCRERKLVGIVFLGGNGNEMQHDLQREGIAIPCVMATALAGEPRLPNLSSVGVDDVLGARSAVEYLIGRGHRRIALVGGRTKQSYSSLLRDRGYRQALEAHHIPVDEGLCQYEEFSLKGGYDAMRRILRRAQGVTAVFAMSDLMAIGAKRAVFERGLRVPEDISLMGFDGIELGRYCTPSLTTVEQPAAQIARISVQLLTACIREEAPPAHQVLETRIIEGGSVRTL